LIAAAFLDAFFHRLPLCFLVTETVLSFSMHLASPETQSLENFRVASSTSWRSLIPSTEIW
jgi:hypothetical protein